MAKQKLPKTAEKEPVVEEKQVEETPVDGPVEATAEAEASKPKVEREPEVNSEASEAVPAEATPTGEEGAPAGIETPLAEGFPPTENRTQVEEVPVEPVPAEPVGSRHYSFLRLDANVGFR